MIIFLKYTENNVQFVVTKTLEDVSNVISPDTEMLPDTRDGWCYVLYCTGTVYVYSGVVLSEIVKLHVSLNLSDKGPGSKLAVTLQLFRYI